MAKTHAIALVFEVDMDSTDKKIMRPKQRENRYAAQITALTATGAHFRKL